MSISDTAATEGAAEASECLDARAEGHSHQDHRAAHRRLQQKDLPDRGEASLEEKPHGAAAFVDAEVVAWGVGQAELRDERMHQTLDTRAGTIRAWC